MSDLLLIRADGNAVIGSGHVMRCLALAEGWQRVGGRAVFALAECTPALERRLLSDGIEAMRLDVIRGGARDATQTAELAKERHVAWIVADGYRFDTAWQREIKDSGLRLLLWDDYGHAQHYCADLILNQSLNASAKMYSRRDPSTRLLLGMRYVQLRREFLDWRNTRRDTPARARKVLVTFGGSDPDNVTGKVIQAIGDLQDVEATVVVGGSNPNVKFLKSSISDLSYPIRLVVDALNMPELMAWADLCVSAAGSTCWELAFLGVPSILTVIAKNQKSIAESLEEAGIARNLGLAAAVSPGAIAKEIDILARSPQKRSAMSERSRSLVDGAGASRVVNVLRRVIKKEPGSVRS